MRLVVLLACASLLSGCTSQGWRNALGGMGRYMANQPARASASNGVLKRSYQSGTNRICVYDDMGSERAVTIAATDLCPIG